MNHPPRTIQPNNGRLAKLMLKLTHYMPVRRSRLIEQEKKNAKLWRVNDDMHRNLTYMRDDYWKLMDQGMMSTVDRVSHSVDERGPDSMMGTIDIVSVYFRDLRYSTTRPPMPPEELREYTKYMMRDVARELARKHAEEELAPMIYDRVMGKR